MVQRKTINDYLHENKILDELAKAQQDQLITLADKCNELENQNTRLQSRIQSSERESEYKNQSILRLIEQVNNFRLTLGICLLTEEEKSDYYRARTFRGF